MEIRQALDSDLPAVYALLCELEECTLPQEAFARTYAHNLAQPRIRYLVAEDQGGVLGFVSLHLDRQLHHADLVGVILELVVAGTHRSQGIGQQLLEAAQREAKLAGCSLVELTSNLHRTRAHAFYERNGWVKGSYKFTYKRLQEEP